MAKSIVDNDATLRQHADEIRKLSWRSVDNYQKSKEDYVECGRRLTLSKEIVGHGNWERWLKDEFQWSDTTAQRCMRAYKLSIKTGTVPDLPIKSLHLLTAKSTSEAAREEVTSRAKRGEKMTPKKVKEVVERTRKPKTAKPAKATVAPATVAQATKPAAAATKPITKPVEQTAEPVKESRTAEPRQWSAEAVEAARAVAVELTKRPLNWIEDFDGIRICEGSCTAFIPHGRYSIFPYEELDGTKDGEFGVEFHFVNNFTRTIGTGESLEEVKRLAEDHWNNWETIASITLPPASDDAVRDSHSVESELVPVDDTTASSIVPPPMWDDAGVFIHPHGIGLDRRRYAYVGED